MRRRGRRRRRRRRSVQGSPSRGHLQYHITKYHAIPYHTMTYCRILHYTISYTWSSPGPLRALVHHPVIAVLVDVHLAPGA